MFTNLKIKIKELAKTAVIKAEKSFGGSMGQQKKAMAIKFVIDQIPVPSIFKPAISFVFSSFIDEAIEFAVELMKNQ